MQQGYSKGASPSYALATHPYEANIYEKTACLDSLVTVMQGSCRSSCLQARGSEIVVQESRLFDQTNFVELANRLSIGSVLVHSCILKIQKGGSRNNSCVQYWHLLDA